MNGIAVQPRVYGPHPPSVAPPAIEKRKQRAITHEVQPFNTYISDERVGPQPLTTTDTDDNDQHNEAEKARLKNMIWLLAREIGCQNQLQKIPSWTGFNTLARRGQESVPKDVVGYLPTINAPATQLTTVNEILRQLDGMKKALNLDEIVIVMDQALYAKASEVIWQHPDQYSAILLRLGTFHTMCNLLSIIDKRYQDAGSRDLCIESGIIAEGSVSGVLEGKMYNRAVRVHKCVYEALMRLVWQQFSPWVASNHLDKLPNLCEVEAHVSEMVGNFSQEQYGQVLHSQAVVEVHELWSQFIQYLKSENGDLCAFWMSYIEVVGDVLLGLIRASREGNRQLHLFAIRQMIPWCFAYDKVKYARYLPGYYAQMKSLQSNHPEVYHRFMESHFSVQLVEENPFGRISVDQTTDVTVNKDTKTTSGVTKFSLKSGAVTRFYLTAEYRCAFLGQLRDMIQLKRPSYHRDELQAPQILKDEKSVTALESLIESWNNPFVVKHSQDLISISTAKEAPADVSQDLMQAHKIGEQAYKQFKEERLETSPPKKKFHDALKLLKLKTFSSLSKKKTIDAKGRAIILRADRSLFGRMIVMGQSRKSEVKELLCHSLGPSPWALATPEGFPRKTNKAA